MSVANKQCPKCQTTCAAESAFCSKCGNQFAAPISKAAPGGLHCPNCGYLLGSFSTNCPRCVSTSSLSVPSAPAMQVTVPVPVPQPTATVSPVPHVQCPSCRQWVQHGMVACPYCTTALLPTGQSVYANNNQAPAQQVFIQNLPSPNYPPTYVNGNQMPVQQIIIQNSSVPAYPPVAYRPRKEKTTAGILALLLGSFGIQHFYLGNKTAGVFSILFCWTYIPLIISFIHGVILLCMNEEDFHARYG